MQLYILQISYLKYQYHGIVRIFRKLYVCRNSYLYKMNKIKFTPAFVIIILFSQNAFSQISGISASKLVVINTETVPANKIEFEPSFNILIQKSDSMPISSDFGFRFTYGLNNKTEIGISLPINMQGINWGIKYQLAHFDKLSFGMIAGIENALIVNNSEVK